MIFIGMILMAMASLTQGQGITSGGAVILIGPIPIIIGGPESNWLIPLGAVITLVALAAWLLARRRICH